MQMETVIEWKEHRGGGMISFPFSLDWEAIRKYEATPQKWRKSWKIKTIICRKQHNMAPIWIRTTHFPLPNKKEWEYTLKQE